MGTYLGRRPSGRPRKDGAISKWDAYVPPPTFSIRDLPPTPLLDELVTVMPQYHYNRVISAIDISRFSKIFEDDELVATALYYIYGGGSISETAKKIYMHRNTLMYRLDRIKEQSGLDIRNFNEAIAFVIIYKLYVRK